MKSIDKKIINGLILSRQNEMVYYLDEQSILCVYNLDENCKKETQFFDKELILTPVSVSDRINNQCLYYTIDNESVSTLYEYDMQSKKLNPVAATPARAPYAAFAEPLYLGKWVAVSSYSTNTIYLWDAEEKQVTTKIQEDKMHGIIGSYENKYLLYSMGEDTIGLLDLENGLNYVLDISNLIEKAQKSIDSWNLDEEYLYAQIICEWDIDPIMKKDEFYRIRLDTLQKH